MEKENILVTRSSMPDYDDYCKKIKSIWDTHWLTNNGPLHAELEEKLKDYLKVNNITLFTNGHLSLENALAALDLKAKLLQHHLLLFQLHMLLQEMD